MNTGGVSVMNSGALTGGLSAGGGRPSCAIANDGANEGAAKSMSMKSIARIIMNSF
jgi:hypothetical protein